MRVRLLTKYADVVELADAWNHLARDVPFLRWEWLGTWWRHFGDGGQLFVPAVFDDDGALMGLAPWWLENHPGLGRVVRFLGSGDVCSDYLSLLTAEERERETADALAAWLYGEATDLRLWDLLDLDGAVANDPAVQRLGEQGAARGVTVHQRDGLNVWRIELPPDWEKYLQLLAKSHRKHVRRALDRFEAARMVLHTVATPEELARGWEVFVDLHQRRRISLGEPGCFASQRFHDFLREAAERLLTAGLLRLHWLEHRDRPLAAEFVFQGGQVAYVYQSGVDPDRLEDEPGHTITSVVLKQSIEQGLVGFDFLRGDEPYKRKWRATPRPLAQWRIVPHRALPQIRHTAWLAGGVMKNWLRQTRAKWAASQ